MKFLKKNLPFILTFAAIALIWSSTIILTKDAPTYDSIAAFGFPLIYSQWGGMCMGGCGDYFSYPYLTFDIAFLILFPFAVQKIWNMLTKKKATKQ